MAKVYQNLLLEDDSRLLLEAGAFSKSITGLTQGTSYRVRAYAVNSAGTSYGTAIIGTISPDFIPQIIMF